MIFHLQKIYVPDTVVTDTIEKIPSDTNDIIIAQVDGGGDNIIPILNSLSFTFVL